MSLNINDIEREAKDKIATLTSLEELEKLRIHYLGRKGALTDILRGLSALPIEERKATGEKANKLRTELETLVADREKELKDSAIQQELRSETAEISALFAFPFPQGHLHPIRQTLDEITSVFKSLGFAVASGPEIETDWYNFEALNIPKDHPARDTQDTFYLEGFDKLMRTHTSPAQCHVMERQKPPVKVIVPGRVFRNEATDATHLPIFHQVEGLVVDEHITFSDLKGTLTLFVRRMFGSGLNVRFRPSHFQFTEPSAELDMQCFKCGGKGCPLCKHEGWIEMLGCGMVHPNVFKSVNYDTEKYTGFAFGMGVERIALLRYDVDDIRLFYENNLQFLKAF